jgi:hypothetical protein
LEVLERVAVVVGQRDSRNRWPGRVDQARDLST